MSKPNFILRPAVWPQDAELLHRIREIVFVLELGVPPELEWDNQDTTAFHLLAFDEAQPIGTARLLPDGRIGRMAVLKNWRGRGVGTALLQGLLQVAGRKQLPTPFLDAQMSALGFYQNLRFRAIGEVFTEAGILHQRMVLISEAMND